ncbi:heparinase [Arsukibacterium sp. MJ3]|uniref:heparinase II/III family protein n=1 Tax=Arsukibacterium sp. MJ3 TaxID=1632859 RepID=UPI0006272167|nr:heparinase II/III family protein [Arsukibacterium sp. MJ3]KKO47839.1 heparinase [Arsukibacterium sp. MJ3]
MLLLTRFQRLYHTVKPLRFEQIFYRMLYKLKPLRNISLIINAPSPASWVWNGPEVLQPSFLGGNDVCFLNLPGKINSAQDWNNTKFEKLWLYNLHYFDDLNAQNSKKRVTTQLRLVQRWVSENPAVSGNGWEPYPLSLRLVNWVKWYNRAQLNNPDILSSIELQASALSKQLEYHILGNHLFANAKALVFVGCFLQGDSADKYLNLGLRILEREIPEQFLPDGGHFELTPMYHCILLWDLLDLINLASISKHRKLANVLPKWRVVAEKALHWLKVMQHPDGEVSFFNDSTMGIAATPAQLFSYATSLSLHLVNLPLPELVMLPVSGYSRISMPEHTLLFDHAAVGPDYLPGHAHADTLSIEWSVGLERVLVNSGTSIYGLSKERLRQRQTAAHNTVEVDNTDSSEVWSGFRVARRAYAKLLDADAKNGKVALTASHDGYKRLKGKVTHLREVDANNKSISITDKLQGEYNNAIVHWHLHPKVKVKKLSDYELSLTLDSGTLLIVRCNIPLQVIPSSWHPGFGETISSNKIVANFLADEVITTFCIT